MLDILKCIAIIKPVDFTIYIRVYFVIILTEFDSAVHAEQDVVALDVPVYDVVLVEEL